MFVASKFLGAIKVQRICPDKEEQPIFEPAQLSFACVATFVIPETQFWCTQRDKLCNVKSKYGLYI
jgi:hypothetical protein